jgi:hypothetical protein
MLVTLFSSDCGMSPVALNPPSVKLSGTWTGTGSDTQGPELIAWELRQTGNMVMGTVTTQAVDTTDGSCASCHKNKSGTVSGTISGTKLTLSMFFPSGGNVPTPMCSVTINATVPEATDSAIATSYSGVDTCEGPFVDGVFSMDHQR